MIAVAVAALTCSVNISSMSITKPAHYRQGTSNLKYRKLDNLKTAFYQVLPLELPGRNSRAREQPETDLFKLARSIADVIVGVMTSELDRQACQPLRAKLTATFSKFV
jgi:hypothetical protein